MYTPTTTRYHLQTMPLYDLDAASQMTHYAPSTVSTYCYNGILERGRDFLIMQFYSGRFRRLVLVLTPAGIERLIDRRRRAIPRAYGNARARSGSKDPST